MKLASLEEAIDHTNDVARRKQRARAELAAAPSFASQLKPVSCVKLSARDRRAFRDAGDLVVALGMLGFKASERLCKGALARPAVEHTTITAIENAKPVFARVVLAKKKPDDDDEIDDEPDDDEIDDQPIDDDDDDDDDEKKEEEKMNTKEMQEAAERIAMLSGGKVTAAQVLRDFAGGVQSAAAPRSSRGGSVIQYDARGNITSITCEMGRK